MHWVENTQYCTVHGGKNPEERRVSDGSAPTDPVQIETRRCLQHSIKIGRYQEVEALPSRGGVEELSVSIYSFIPE